METSTYPNLLADPSSTRKFWRGRRKTADSMLDRYGAELYLLARVLIDDPVRAEELVRQTIAATRFSFLRRKSLDERVFAREFAGLIYLHCFDGDSSSTGSLCRRLRILPDDHRAALALCTFGGHTYRQAADILDISARRVAKLLREALRDLDNAGRITMA